MLWLILIYASVPFVLIVGGILAHRARQIRLTWWCLPVLLCTWLLSLRVAFIMLICGYLFAAATGGGRPALWLRELWAAHSWPLALVGTGGLVAVFALRGIRPVSRGSWVICLSVAIGLIGISTAQDGLLFRLTYSGFGGKPQEVADAVSPDGQLRVRAFGAMWLDGVWYDLEAEANSTYPIIAHPLVTGDADESVWPYAEGDIRIVWSLDSKVTALWFKNTPIVAYDFARRIGLCRSPATWSDKAENQQEYESADELQRALAELMEQHGGPAP
jgi:hypothetical protein